MILTSHRQAWCWQDEYVDLSMDDVRQLEAETQAYLMAKMRHDTASIDKLDAIFEQQQKQLSRRTSSRGSKDGMSVASKSALSVHSGGGGNGGGSGASKLRLKVGSRTGSEVEKESTLKNVIEYSTGASEDYEDFPSNEDDEEKDEDDAYEQGIDSLVKQSSGRFHSTSLGPTKTYVRKSMLGYSDKKDKNNNEFTDLYNAHDDEEVILSFVCIQLNNRFMKVFNLQIFKTANL
jgi:hypothetical protein